MDGMEQLLNFLKGLLQKESNKTGLPTSYYVGSSRLGDFSVPKWVYDFKVTSPTPDLSKLREPLKLDFDLAGKLFVARYESRDNKEDIVG